MPLTGNALERAKRYVGLWEYPDGKARVTLEDGELVARDPTDPDVKLPIGTVLMGRRVGD